MGGFLGLGNSSAKTDRKTTLQGFGDLSNLFNFGLDTSKGLLSSGSKDVGSGVNAMGTGLDFFKKLLSGDRTTMTQAVAPETNAVLNQSDAARNNRATMGTARGGGTAGANQTAQDKSMATIDNYLFGARPAAAGQVADIGGKIANVGLGETSAALGFGNLAEDSAANLTKDAIGSRMDSQTINQDMVNQVTSTISDVLGAIF